MSQCLTNDSDNTHTKTSLDEREDCYALEQKTNVDACLAELRDSTKDLRSRCLEKVKSKCAMVNFDAGKILGCDQFKNRGGIGGTPPIPDDAPVGPPVVDADLKPNPSPQPEKPALNKNDPKLKPAESVARQSEPESPAQAQSQAEADISQCTNVQQRASQCCNNPASCMGSTSTREATPSRGGIAGYCQQMRQAGLSNARTNNSAAMACYNSYSTCTGTCDSLVSKYESLIRSCNGTCASASVYEQALARLTSSSQTCSQYSRIVTALGQQSEATADAGEAGQDCEAVAKASPS